VDGSDRADFFADTGGFIQTQVRTDVYLRVREVMEHHNLSASGAVHHLLRERFGLPPLPPFDQQPISTDSTNG
jgi:hypothetical protein